MGRMDQASKAARFAALTKEHATVTSRPRILFVSPIPPADSRGGTNQRISAQYDALRELGDIDSIIMHPRPDEVTTWPEGYGPRLATFRRPPLPEMLGRFDPRGGSIDAAVFQAAPFMNYRRMHRLPEANVQQFRSLRPERYDLVFISRLSNAWGLGWTDPRRTIVDIDDVVSQKFQPAPGLGFKSRLLAMLRYARVRRTERKALDEYRLLLVCSPRDVEYLRGHPHVAVLPNCYWPHPDMDAPPDPEPAGSMLFVATFNYKPNVDGMAWFVQQVLPLVRREMPEARVKISGYRQPGLALPWLQSPGVEDLGYVSDIGPLVRECRLTICPLLEGYGTRIKILESLAFSKPVVSTTIGAYGHPMGEAQGVYRRDDAAGFAKACVELLRDSAMRREVAEAGRRYVVERYSKQAVQQRLQELAKPVLDGR